MSLSCKKRSIINPLTPGRLGNYEILVKKFISTLKKKKYIIQNKNLGKRARMTVTKAKS